MVDTTTTSSSVIPTWHVRLLPIHMCTRPYMGRKGRNNKLQVNKLQSEQTITITHQPKEHKQTKNAINDH